MRRAIAAGLLGTTLATVLVATPSASAGQPTDPPVISLSSSSASSDAAVRDYWTPARMREAIERGAPNTKAISPAIPAAPAQPLVDDRRVGLLFGTIGGRNFSCSAAGLFAGNADGVIETAAHCLVVTEGTVQNAMYAPAFNNNARPLGTFVGREGFITGRYVRKSVNDTRVTAFDTGYLTLSKNGAGQRLGDIGATFNAAFGGPPVGDGTFVGYPGGSTQVACSGTTRQSTSIATNWAMDACASAPGSSGGPLIGNANAPNAFVIGTNSGGSSSAGGHFWESSSQKAYQDATGAHGTTLQ